MVEVLRVRKDLIGEYLKKDRENYIFNILIEEMEKL